MDISAITAITSVSRGIGNMISIHPEKCTGCRACEVVCSYHHTGFFGRKKGSIQVKRNEEDGRMVPILYTVKENGYERCDDCFGETNPLCVKFCVTGALKIVEE